MLDAEEKMNIEISIVKYLHQYIAVSLIRLRFGWRITGLIGACKHLDFNRGVFDSLARCISKHMRQDLLETEPVCTYGELSRSVSKDNLKAFILDFKAHRVHGLSEHLSHRENSHLR